MMFKFISLNRAIFLSVFFVMLMFQSVQAQDEFSVKQIIQKIIDDWKDGYNNGDAVKVRNLYASDAIYLTQHFYTGIVPGLDSIQAYVQAGINAEYRIDKIEILKFDYTNDFIYAIIRYESINDDKKDFGLNLVVLKKINEKWLIVAHESTVPDVNTAIHSLPINK